MHAAECATVRLRRLSKQARFHEGENEGVATVRAQDTGLTAQMRPLSGRRGAGRQAHVPVTAQTQRTENSRGRTPCPRSSGARRCPPRGRLGRHSARLGDGPPVAAHDETSRCSLGIALRRRGPSRLVTSRCRPRGHARSAGLCERRGTSQTPERSRLRVDGPTCFRAGKEMFP